MSIFSYIRRFFEYIRDLFNPYYFSRKDEERYTEALGNEINSRFTPYFKRDGVVLLPKKNLEKIV